MSKKLEAITEDMSDDEMAEFEELLGQFLMQLSVFGDITDLHLQDGRLTDEPATVYDTIH